jgi:hypothetical protein
LIAFLQELARVQQAVEDFKKRSSSNGSSSGKSSGSSKGRKETKRAAGNKDGTTSTNASASPGASDRDRDRAEANENDNDEEIDDKGEGEGDSSEGNAGSSDAMFFQNVWFAPIELKINYEPAPVDLSALQHGDSIQLLNLFPIDSLELTLKKIKMSGLTGFGAVLSHSIEHWVKDIYANQMHRVISGTAPFRGLSNIGTGLQNLLLIPAKEYSHSYSSSSSSSSASRGLG